MCRFVAYLGDPIILDELIFKPKNSLVNQSIRANEAEEPLNGDGFGIGWYMHKIDRSPALYVSVRPAWNDRNLLYLAPKIQSRCIFAHVRAATAGGVNELNCHPFHFKNLLFMHNGDICGFENIKRPLEQVLTQETYNMLEGQTDSEHLFALLIDNLDKQKEDHTAEEIAAALEMAIADITALKRKHNIAGDDYINAAITDGNSMVAIRYLSDTSLHAPTLYYSQGTAYECIDGICKMRADKKEKAVLVVSEKLTDILEDWKEMPVNHILIVENKLKTRVREIALPERG
jgi:glutamine amidotransferase